jgi:hypothetical protein
MSITFTSDVDKIFFAISLDLKNPIILQLTKGPGWLNELGSWIT